MKSLREFLVGIDFDVVPADVSSSFLDELASFATCVNATLARGVADCARKNRHNAEGSRSASFGQRTNSESLKKRRGLLWLLRNSWSLCLMCKRQ